MYSIQTSKSSTDDEFTVQTLKHAGNEMGMLSNSILHFSVIQKTPVMDLKLYHGTKTRDPLKKTDLRSLGMQLTQTQTDACNAPAHPLIHKLHSLHFTLRKRTIYCISVCRSYFSLTYRTHIKLPFSPEK